MGGSKVSSAFHPCKVDETNESWSFFNKFFLLAIFREREGGINSKLELGVVCLGGSYHLVKLVETVFQVEDNIF